MGFVKGSMNIFRTPTCARMLAHGKHRVGCAFKSTAPRNVTLENPLDELSKFSQVPLLEENDHVFRPSLREVQAAQPLFKGKVEQWKGAISVEGKHKLKPAILPEVAFIGRSNAGKSTLIKTLFFNAPVRIDISRKPGRTRTIQVYEVENVFSLVDMPGYGENMPPYYHECVEKYLLYRDKLVRTFLLLDLTAGVTEEDRIGINMLHDTGAPYALVLTKCDALTTGEQLRHVYDVIKLMKSELHNTCYPQPFIVSALTDTGMAFLRSFITNVTSQQSIAKKLYGS